MSYSGAAQRYIVKIIGKHFGLSTPKVEDFLGDEATYSEIDDFLKGSDKVSRLLFFYQSRDVLAENGEVIEELGAPPEYSNCLTPLAFPCHLTA